MELNRKLEMPLDEVIQETSSQQDRRPRGGGRLPRGKRYSSRIEDAKPYSRRPPHINIGEASGPTTRVYVGNLAWQTSWQDLKDHMRKAGNVKRADVFLDEQGRSKGCGIVEYSTPEEAQSAIHMLNDTKVDDTDRLIFVREDREDRGFTQSVQRGGHTRGMVPAGRGRGGFGSFDRSNLGARPSAQGRQVFVGNLPYATSWQDLKDQFRQCGNVVRADVLIDASGRPKGQGTVLFETSYEAQNAINMLDNTEFQSRLLTVHEDKFA